MQIETNDYDYIYKCEEKNPELFLWWIDLVAPSDSREVGNYEKKNSSHNISDKSFNRNEIERQLLETGKKKEKEEVVWYYQYNMETSCCSIITNSSSTWITGVKKCNKILNTQNEMRYLNLFYFL